MLRVTCRDFEHHVGFVEVDSIMTTLYLLAAVVGGTVLVCQIILTVLGLALLAGSGAFYGVAWLMRQLTRLDDEGTVSPEDAIDRTATVYLRIPSGGQGKVHVTVGQQVMELSARSPVEREVRNGVEPCNTTPSRCCS
jgi:membrane protein implicated in regulation of membrane protease activity